eukprot:5686451-Amphidinium_carterae.1
MQTLKRELQTWHGEIAQLRSSASTARHAVQRFMLQAFSFSLWSKVIASWKVFTSLAVTRTAQSFRQSVGSRHGHQLSSTARASSHMKKQQELIQVCFASLNHFGSLFSASTCR